MTRTKALLAAAAFGLTLMLIPTEASAWYCRADSPSAYGWADNYSLNAARRRALRECAARTPRYQTCRISYCR